MLDTPREKSHPTQPRAPGAGARAVLFGYLLRSRAHDKAAIILERLDVDAISRLVGLLDGEELRQMATLCFSDAHIGRTIGLDVPALTRLCRAGDHDAVERCVRRLPTAIVQRILPALADERRRALNKSLDRPAGALQRDRFWAALRLRRLFQR